MKIGVVCYPSLGGSGIVATELGHELGLRGHEVHFITYEIPFRLRLEEENIFFHEVEINNYDLFKYPDYALTLAVKIANVAKQHKLDLLHVHYAIPHATSAYLAKQILGSSDLKVITTLHGTDITLVGQDPAYSEIVKYSIDHSDGVTAVSENLREQTCKTFQIEQSIEVIHNFFTPKPNIHSIRDQFVEPNEKLLLHSSNFRSVKRVEDVVKIVELVNQEVPSKLLFLGSGSEMDQVRNLVTEADLGDSVIFLGISRDIDPYVASADLFLLPSEHESFGLSALEAMAYGVPVIASNTGGLPEVVENGKCGYLSSVGDFYSMANNAITLLNNPALHQEMSQNAARIAKENFSAEKILPEWINYYEKVLNSG